MGGGKVFEFLDELLEFAMDRFRSAFFAVSGEADDISEEDRLLGACRT
ncbi:MAG: hypothetical protein ACI9MB_001896 [Verrucomicrobiales bacterium]|jgi:hypothetical protein